MRKTRDLSRQSSMMDVDPSASAASYNTTLVLLVLCLLILYFYCINSLRIIHNLYRHIPGPPKSNIILGHILDIKRAMEDDNLMIQELFYQWSVQYGPTFKIFIFHKPVIITTHPMGVKEVLLGGHPKTEELYARLRNLYGVRFLGTGLVTLTDNSSHSHRRKAMDPAFRRQFLKGLMEQFNSSSEIFIEKLSEHADGRTFVPMAEKFQSITLDLIGKVAFSMDIDSINDPHSRFPAAIKTILKAMYAQLFQGEFGLNPWRRGFYAEAREAVLFLRRVGQELIEARQAALLKGDDSVPDDVLTHAIKTAEKDKDLTLESMLDDFITFFIAGHETSANTLSFILLELGRRPAIVSRLREEIERVVGNDDSLQYHHISRLHYMNMVIKESMRLYPTAPSTFRKLNRECDIAGYVVPKGTIVGVSTYVASRNPSIFDRPLEFDPERFDPAAPNKVPIYSCFPFSLGPRSCIGRTFTLIQTKVILAKFLIEFDFQLDMNQSFGMKEVATLKPKSDVSVILTRRHQKQTDDATTQSGSSLSNSTQL